MPAAQRYSGKYRVKKPHKYIGDHTNVSFRSSWERAAFIWCEKSDRVKKWGSEIVILDYICGTDKKLHKYHVDLFIEWEDGTKSLIEIKPERELSPPKKGKRQTKKYLIEVNAYIKNSSKFKVGESYAKKQGWKWEIWTEHVMRGLGIRIV